MSNSSSSKHLHYLESKKITNKNSAFRSTNNLTQHSSVIKPFSRKPGVQADQPFLHNSDILENDLDISTIEKSLLQVQSVVSGGRSVRERKFVRTNNNGFLSPKGHSKKKNFQQSFSPDTTYGTQSMILRAGTSQIRKSIKDCVKQKASVESQASSKEQNEYFMQKSVSSINLLRKNNKTRNMILSKFSELSRKSKDKTQKSKLDTSIQATVYENEKQERKKIEKINDELKQKNAKAQKQYENLSKQNTILANENFSLKNQIAQIKKKLQQSQSIGFNSLIPQKNVSPPNIQSYYQSTALRTRPSIPLPVNQNKKCQKCEQKQKSNQKQVNYFENIIKKKETQLVALKRKQSLLIQQNSQVSQSLQQTRQKFNELLEHEKITTQNERKLEECVNELKEEVARLKDELRYLHIENSVLLKIKNENLKLKIDITKIEHERDYFKMKAMEIHKKNGNLGHTRTLSEKFMRQKTENKKQALLQKSKKFYLESTETEQMDSFNIEIGQKHHKKMKSTSSGSETSRQMNSYKYSKPKISQSDSSLSSSYADALFDLTSQESENSY